MRSPERAAPAPEPVACGRLDVRAIPAATQRTMQARLASARALHAKLEGALGPLDLIVTDNRRRMVSTRRGPERRELRLHHMFLDCPGSVAAELARFVRGSDASKQRLRAFVSANTSQINYTARRSSHRAVGDHHDLGALLERARALLGAEAPEAISITWGRRARGARTIRFGSFDFEARLVRIHPALDRAWVPPFFVEYIIYHELVHAIRPPRVGPKGRRLIHTPEFRALERCYPRYAEAMAWERENIARFFDGAR